MAYRKKTLSFLAERCGLRSAGRKGKNGGIMILSCS